MGWHSSHADCYRNTERGAFAQTAKNNNKVEAPETQNPTLAEFEVENSSFLSKMCKLIPAGSMTSNLPMIPIL